MNQQEAIRRLDMIAAAIRGLNDPEIGVFSVNIMDYTDGRPSVFLTKMPKDTPFTSHIDATHEFCRSIDGEVEFSTCERLSEDRVKRIAAAVAAAIESTR